MALSTDDIRQNYPIPAYNYRVSIGSDTLAFAEVSGLSMSYETVTYRHGLSWREGDLNMPARRQPVNIRLNRGIVKGGSYLADWINTIRINSVEKEDIFIDLCDETGTPVVTWAVLNAFPTKLDAPGFDANTNDVAIETLEIMADEIQLTFHE